MTNAAERRSYVEIEGDGNNDASPRLVGLLLNSYNRHATTRGWGNVKVYGVRNGYINYVHIVQSMKGETVFDEMQWEVGIHIAYLKHLGMTLNCAAAVMVYPEVAEDEYPLDLNEVVFRTEDHPFPPHQVVLHQPTGVTVRALKVHRKSSAQAQADRLLKHLRAKLYALQHLPPLPAEPVRTYNQVSKTLTDHRTGQTADYDLLMRGGLMSVFGAPVAQS